MKHSFWAGKTVFLTGHTGFKGSWLTLWLKEMGANVVGFSLDKPSSPALFDLIDGKNSCKDITGDIRDAQALTNALQSSKAEIVLHLAAQSLVRLSYERPIETYAVNVMGTINVLEAIRNTPSVKVALIVTTDKCYENKEWVWGYRETDALGGYDPYSSSKACAEIVTNSWRQSFFRDGQTQIASARAGNVIGGGDWAKDRIIPDLIRALNEGSSPIIRNPMATRPWQHVLDPLAGYLTLAEKLWSVNSQVSEAWNFGPSEDSVKPVEWIANRVCEKYGSKMWVKDQNIKNPHEANLLALDCSKARVKLGWKPRWDIEQSLDETINWYQAFRDNSKNIREFTINQIKSFASAEVV